MNITLTLVFTTGHIETHGGLENEQSISDLLAVLDLTDVYRIDIVRTK